MWSITVGSLVFVSLNAALCLEQDPGVDPVLSKHGLKPTLLVTAVDGKASFGVDESVELVGATDLAESDAPVWDVRGRLLDGPSLELFWRIMDLPKKPVNLRDEYGRDKDGRTFAMAFRLSRGLTEANDVRQDVNKTFVPMLSETRPATGTGPGAYVGEMRIVKPIVPKGSDATTFDFRLEVPGGSWVTLAEFVFGPDIKLDDGSIDLKQRWQSFSDFRTVDGAQTIVDYKGYYFTVTLPAPMRDMELEILTNDPSGDASFLPAITRQHIRGEEQGEAFAGKDLFLVYGLKSGSEARRFTLRARPKRIAVFKDVPFKRI